VSDDLLGEHPPQSARAAGDQVSAAALPWFHPSTSCKPTTHLCPSL
jgi:hypothetical protein